MCVRARALARPPRVRVCALSCEAVSARDMRGTGGRMRGKWCERHMTRPALRHVHVHAPRAACAHTSTPHTPHETEWAWRLLVSDAQRSTSGTAPPGRVPHARLRSVRPFLSSTSASLSPNHSLVDAGAQGGTAPACGPHQASLHSSQAASAACKTEQGAGRACERRAARGASARARHARAAATLRLSVFTPHHAALHKSIHSTSFAASFAAFCE